MPKKVPTAEDLARIKLAIDEIEAKLAQLRHAVDAAIERQTARRSRT